MKRFVILTVLLFILAGCAAQPPITQVGGLYTSKPDNFSVELPQGWKKLSTKEGLRITKDGFLLQEISIGRFDIDEPLGHTKKKISGGMLPQEVAEVLVDDSASDPEVFNFNMIENTPADISGFPGFKLVGTYKNKDGLKFKTMYYGFISGQWLYAIHYTATSRYYFDRDVETFQKVVQSFKLNE